jgi:hypothetical protein
MEVTLLDIHRDLLAIIVLLTLMFFFDRWQNQRK